MLTWAVGSTDKTTLWGDISTLPDNFASPRGVGANVHTLVHNQIQAQGQEAGALIYVPHQVIVVSDRGVYEDLKARNHNIPRSADGAGSADVVFVEGGIQVLLPFRGSRFGVLSSYVYCSLCARVCGESARAQAREREPEHGRARWGVGAVECTGTGIDTEAAESGVTTCLNLFPEILANV